MPTEQLNTMNTMSLTPLSRVPDIIFFMITGLTTFFSPMVEQYVFLLIIILANTISGIGKSSFLGRSFSWKLFLRTFVKMGWFTLIVIVGWIVDAIFVFKAFGQMYMFSIFILLLALAEFKSIADNLSTILGFDIWRKVIGAFKKDADIVDNLKDND